MTVSVLCLLQEVLDFLFHRQSLTEKGYPAGRVEDALDLFNEDVDKACHSMISI